MEDPVPHIRIELVIKVIKLMKCGKAAGTSLIIAEMLKASGVERVQQMRDLINDIIHFRKIPTEWEESIIISLCNGVALDRGNYRGLKLLDQDMKFLERVDENFLQQQVCMNDMQFDFMPGRSNTDAIFIVRQSQEKFMASTRDFTWPLSIWKRMSMGKPLCRCPGHHDWIAGGIAREAGPLEDQHGKGLRVNMGKTKVLISLLGLDVLQKSGKDPCGMCLNGVGTNSIFCGGCFSWILKKCSSIPGPLKPYVSFKCEWFTG